MSTSRDKYPKIIVVSKFANSPTLLKPSLELTVVSEHLHRLQNDFKPIDGLSYQRSVPSMQVWIQTEELMPVVGHELTESPLTGQRRGGGRFEAII